MWQEVLFWVSVVVYLLLLINTVLVLVLENRQPAKTVVWLFIVWLLPIIGFILFYFFGQDFRREWKLRHNAAKTYRAFVQQYLHGSKPVEISQKYAPLATALESHYGMPLQYAKETKLFDNGDDFFKALLHDISLARHHIHIETYLIEDDSVGRMFIDALTEKASNGIEVRLLYDDVGNWNVSESFYKKLKAAGGIVEASQPVRFPRLTRKVNYRNHRKIAIVDGLVGYIGGMNFAERYASRNGELWNDLHLRLCGDIVASLQSVFLWDWSLTPHRTDIRQDYFPATEDNASVHLPCQIMSSSPFSDCPSILFLQTWLFHNAKRCIYIQTPYFLPSDSILQALQTAAFTGVDIRIMVPMTPDSRVMKWANESYFTDVLKAGVKLYRYQGGFLHTKMVMVDNEIASVGSSNMDFRSYENNFEANAIVYDKGMAEKLCQKFENDMQACEQLSLDTWQDRPVWHRLKESTVRIFSPLL